MSASFEELVQDLSGAVERLKMLDIDDLVEQELNDRLDVGALESYLIEAVKEYFTDNF